MTELQKKLPTMQQKLSQPRHSEAAEEARRVDRFQKEIPSSLDGAWRRCRKVTLLKITKDYRPDTRSTALRQITTMLQG